MMMKSQRAFTVIELLIVVAIIALLAAIAVPNFLEAQTRAKASAAFADMRTMAVAVECYRVDWNGYPLDGAILRTGQMIYPTQNPSDVANAHVFAGPALSTPIAYLAAQPHDPFEMRADPAAFQLYFYANLDQASRWLTRNMGMVPPLIQQRMDVWGSWMMLSGGPDGDRMDVGSMIGPEIVLGYYDPTNGTVSNGDILLTQRMGQIGGR